jgi:flagellar hook-basal body complex protein FliE
MRVDLFTLQPTPSRVHVEKRRVAVKEVVKDFKTLLKEGLQRVNKAQLHSQTLTKQLAEGEVKNVHDVMIASQKAEMMMELTTEIVRRLMRAYNTLIMYMR